MTDSPRRTGGQILAQALAVNGTRRVFCVPGESFLPVLDALYEHSSIDTIVTRHEGAASNMAAAHGKLTGRPGVAIVTRGPGSTHAANGVHTAFQDSAPMILLVGQVGREFMGREAFQELDYARVFGGVAKWAVEVDSAERLPEIMGRAFATAMSGRPGPVVVALPEDVLFGTACVADAPAVRVGRAAPEEAAVEEMFALLDGAERPLVVVGGGDWTADACNDLARFADAHDLPVAASFRRQDLIDNRSPCYVGQLGLGVSAALAEGVRQADLLLVLGSRLSEVTTSGYTLIDSPVPRQKLVHAHPDASEIGRVFQPALPIVSSMPSLLAALAKRPARRPAPWASWTRQLRSAYEAHSTPPVPMAGSTGVDMAAVVSHLNRTLPEDAIICNGAGNYTVWVHRFFHYKRHRTELAPVNGAMGFGLPAAIAAKLHAPERTVVCFAGDGCFMMYPQELATAMQWRANVVVLVVNNGILGTIRMHQEREYPGRVSGTSLQNPDFVALARAFGAHAERVEKTEDFESAFARAQACGRPALIELVVDPQQLTPSLRIQRA